MSPQPAFGVPDQPTDPTHAAIPNPRLWSRRNMHWLYDLAVVYGTLPWVWNCPWQRVAALYAAAVDPGARMLEVAPGTGFYLDRLRPPLEELHLLDLHEGALEVSAERLVRYQPVIHRHDALEPFPLDEGSVDVVALSMVLHCLPGEGIHAKSTVFDHISQVLPRGGVCIGGTVLAHGVPQSLRSKAALRFLNARGVFHNRGDSLTDLRDVLHSRFDQVRLAVAGSVALWEATAR